MRLGNLRWLLAAAALSACGEAADNTERVPPLTAATLGEQAIRPVSAYLTTAEYAGADRENGRQLAFTCRACHTLEAGGADLIGPNLHGIFGAQAGNREAFDYSEAIREADFVWTPRALDAWLREPGAFLPGNRMSFIGVSSESDRRDLIAYLLVATDTDNR